MWRMVCWALLGLVSTYPYPALSKQATQFATEKADETVLLRASRKFNGERIVFDWSGDITYGFVHLNDEQVEIRFDRQAHFDLSGLGTHLGQWIQDVRVVGESLSQVIVLDVVPGALVQAHQLPDHRVIFDVTTVASAADQQEPDDGMVRLRGGRNSDGERIVFDWSENVTYEFARIDAERAAIRFDRQAHFDLSGLGTHLGQWIQDVRVEGESLSQVIVLDVVPGAAVRVHQLPNHHVTIDVTNVAATPSTADKPEVTTDGIKPEGEDAIEPESSDHAASNVAPEEPAAEPVPAAPGQFEVDEDEIDRALDRTLVQSGALLLPVGWIELEPRLSYLRRELDTPLLFIDGDPAFLAEGSVRRDEILGGLSLRVGLPFDSQLELDLPYRYVDQSTVAVVNGVATEDDTDGSGFGDFSVGIAKTIFLERDWRPDLVGRLTWDTASGRERNDGVVLGTSVNEIIGSLSAVKRQDPLAFTGGLSYRTAFEQDGLDPGDEVGLSLGAILAASPETSLRLTLSQRFIQETSLDGDRIAGSDGVVGVLSIGASSILGLGAFLDVSADIGLTDDAPDYAVTVSVPIRFNIMEIW